MCEQHHDEMFCGLVVWCVDVMCVDPIAVTVSGEELTVCERG